MIQYITYFDIFSRVQNKLGTIYTSVISYFRHIDNTSTIVSKSMLSGAGAGDGFWKKIPGAASKQDGSETLL